MWILRKTAELNSHQGVKQRKQYWKQPIALKKLLSSQQQHKYS